MSYLLDADTFIAAKNLYYGMDFCPGYWEWLVQAHEAGRVFSVEKVGDELLAGRDELAAWAKERGDDFFLPLDDETIPPLTELVAWVQRQEFRPAAISQFFQSGDYYLIAYALAHKHTVVTQEVAAPDAVRRVKIPTACIGLRIKCVNCYQMLRAEGARFVLDAAGGGSGAG